MDEVEANLLRAFLADSDVHCPGCGYNLRGLTGAQCPECGAELRLQLAAATPSLRVNFAGLIGLAAGAGWNGLSLICLLGEQIYYYLDITNWPQFLSVHGVALAVFGLALFLWLKYWRFISRMDAKRKLALACFCWALTLFDVAVCGAKLG